MKKYLSILLNLALLIATGSSRLHAMEEQQTTSDQQNEQQEKTEKEEEIEQIKQKLGLCGIFKSTINTTYTIVTTVSGAVSIVGLVAACAKEGPSGIADYFDNTEELKIAAVLFLFLLPIKYLYKIQKALDRILDNLGRENEEQAVIA